MNVFDPRAVWLLDHYDARPYGTGSSVSGGEDTPEAGPRRPQPAEAAAVGWWWPRGRAGAAVTERVGLPRSEATRPRLSAAHWLAWTAALGLT